MILKRTIEYSNAIKCSQKQMSSTLSAKGCKIQRYQSTENAEFHDFCRAEFRQAEKHCAENAESLAFRPHRKRGNCQLGIPTGGKGGKLT